MLFLFWALLLAGVFFWMLPDKTVPPELQGILRPEPKPLQAFELNDQYQQPFNLKHLQGKWSFVFFGYTHCPDICPTTLSTLTQVIKKLQADQQILLDTQVVFVSVDPQRDTPEALESYMKYFSEAFKGITGTQHGIDSLTRQFGAGYIQEPETAPGEYLVSHASSIFLVNPQGQLLAILPPPHDPDTIVEQFQQIRSLF